MKAGIRGKAPMKKARGCSTKWSEKVPGILSPTSDYPLGCVVHALAIMHSNYTVAVLLWLWQGNHGMATCLSSFRHRKSRNEIYFNTRNSLLFLFFEVRPHEILAIYRMKEVIVSQPLMLVNGLLWPVLVACSADLPEHTNSALWYMSSSWPFGYSSLLLSTIS